MLFLGDVVEQIEVHEVTCKLGPCHCHGANHGQGNAHSLKFVPHCHSDFLVSGTLRQSRIVPFFSYSTCALFCLILLFI